MTRPHPCPPPPAAWWASFDGGEAYRIGPFDTREDVIAEAVEDGDGWTGRDGENPPRHVFTIARCQSLHVDLSKKFDAEDWLERLYDDMQDEEGSDECGDYHPLESITDEDRRDIQESVRLALWHWQERKQKKLRGYWFGLVTDEEKVVVLAEDDDE